MHDLVDSAGRDTDVPRKPVLADPHWIEELLQQDLTGVNWWSVLLRHCLRFSVVVDDFNVVRISLCPDEADAPLVIDSNTILARAISGEPLQAIAWGHPKVMQVLGSVQHSELSLGNALQVSREPARMPSTEDPLGLAVAKAANHATEGSNRWT